MEVERRKEVIAARGYDEFKVALQTNSTVFNISLFLVKFQTFNFKSGIIFTENATYVYCLVKTFAQFS